MGWLGLLESRDSVSLLCKRLSWGLPSYFLSTILNQGKVCMPREYRAVCYSNTNTIQYVNMARNEGVILFECFN